MSPVLLSAPVRRNLRALLGGHLVTYALPLLTTPFLARTLGPAAWGVLAAAQAFALLCALLIEFGFDLSGAREAARRQTDRAGLGQLLSGITTAKVVLTGAAALLTLAAQQLVPVFREQPLLLWAAFGWAAAQAWN
ncbi:oligosaccharide flippase family protein, partial [Deinococcus sp.]|uniref:oligosaccharide flippase family protein n=1 Tax=Deinococcus sp. TaxID=47478 RepID=UPI00391B6356